jgi:hypothetical protein
MRCMTKLGVDLHKALVCASTLSVLALGGSAFAQGSPDAPEKAQAKTEASNPVDGWRYAAGFHVSASLSPEGNSRFKLRPDLGFRYGRWRIGMNADQDQWLGLRATDGAAVGYDLGSNDKDFRSDLSLRLQQIKAPEDRTDSVGLSSRAVVAQFRSQWRATPAWTIQFVGTQDLTNQGAGTTAQVQIQRKWAIGQHSSLSFAAGPVWGSAKHWQAPYLKSQSTAVQAASLNAGIGYWSAGLSLRQPLSKDWAWFTSVSAYERAGDLRKAFGGGLGWNTQTGLVRFGSL